MEWKEFMELVYCKKITLQVSPIKCLCTFLVTGNASAAGLWTEFVLVLLFLFGAKKSEEIFGRAFSWKHKAGGMKMKRGRRGRFESELRHTAGIPRKKGEVRRLVQITLLFPLSFSPGDTTWQSFYYSGLFFSSGGVLCFDCLPAVFFQTDAGKRRGENAFAFNGPAVAESRRVRVHEQTFTQV